MDREQIIQEMKLDAKRAYYDWDNVPKDPIQQICEGLCDVGYRKIHDGSVVLTREELEKLKCATANDFAEIFENYLCDVITDYCTNDTAVPEALFTSAEIDKVMDRTLKDFGVEV